MFWSYQDAVRLNQNRTIKGRPQPVVCRQKSSFLYSQTFTVPHVADVLALLPSKIANLSSQIQDVN